MFKIFKRRIKQAYILMKSNGIYTILIQFLQLLRKKIFIEKFLKGFSFSPQTISIFLTENCNLRCNYCVVNDIMNTHKKFKYIELKYIIKLLDDVKYARPLIYLTGGEPFIRKDILDFIKEIKKRKLILTINTNATLLNEKILDTLIELQVDSITISLDGTQEEHDFVRGNGTFDTILSNIKLLSDLKKKKSSRLPIVRINTVVSDSNMINIVKIYEWYNDNIYSYVDYIQFQLMAFIPKDYVEKNKKIFGDEAMHFGTVTPNNVTFEHAKVVKKLQDRISNDEKTIITPNTDYEKYFSNSWFKGSSCTAPYYEVEIYSNGDVSPCIVPYGNIKNTSFKYIWNNKEFMNFRKSLINNKLYPACFRCCRLNYED